MTPFVYPKLGHAADYSWIAGQVAFTQIQGGCIYIYVAGLPIEALPTPTAVNPVGSGSVVVGTAVRSDTSPPLRDITPVQPSAETPQAITGAFVPGGPGWDPSKVKDGDYVVAFGRVAGPGDVREMCPGGTHYVVDRMQPNP